MRLIAHRGFAATAPENTIGAIRAAADRADAVEFDVRRCGSGDLVVIHDERIDRVTGGTGAVADAPLEALRTETVLESGERIPTLAEVLDAVPPDVDVTLELKEPGIAIDAIETLDEAALENRVVVTSFLPTEVRTVREVAPDRPAGLLVSRDLETPVTTAVALGCDVLGANYWRCLGTRIVPRAKAVDLEVHAWTVERPLAAKPLALRGVDYVSADRPLRV